MTERAEEAVKMGLVESVPIVGTVETWFQDIPDRDWQVLKAVFQGWKGRLRDCRMTRGVYDHFCLQHSWQSKGKPRYASWFFTLGEARLFKAGGREFGRMLRKRAGR